MATNSKRDVRLGVEIETTGEDSVKRLAADVRKLAQEGGDAAPEFAKLAAELDKLAEQSNALAGVRALTEQVQKLTVEQAEAAAATARVGERYAEVSGKAQGLREEQARLGLAVNDATLAVVKAKGDLKAYGDGFTKAGKDTLEFAQRQGELSRTLASAEVELKKQTIAAKALAPAVKAATAEEKKYADQLEALSTKARENEAALQRRNKALQEAQAAAVAAGAGTTDLVAADTALLAAIQRVANETTALAAAQREAAATSEALADLDRKNEAALGRLLAQQRQTIEAYEASEVAAREEAQAVEKSAAAALEKAAADAKAAAAAEQLRAEQRELVATFREADVAARRFVESTKALALAGQEDVDALQARRRAAEALLRADRDLSDAQRAQLATRDANRAALIAEAQALLAAAEAADKSRIATERLVAASRRAGESIEAAFGATGIRSINAIEQEIRETEVALERLNAAARKGALGTNELERAAGAAAVKISRLQAEILQVQALPGTFERLGGSVNNLVTKFGALSAVLATVGFAALPVLQSFIKLESTTRILTTITGNAASAAEQIEFLRVTAQRSGQAFDDIATPYSKFAASALQTGLSLKDTQEVFASVSLAAGNLGLSSDQVSRALEALSQIASKGVVSMEELRGQLGDALPGVLPLLAKELGLTTQELNKVVESGNLLAFEAIPAIGRSLKTLGTEGGKPVEGLVAEFNRLKNAVFEATNIIATGAVGQALGKLFGAASISAQVLALGVAVITENFTLLGKQIGIVAGGVTTGFTGMGAALAEATEESRLRLTGLAERISGVGTASTDAATGARALGNEVKTATEALDDGASATDAQVKSLAALALANQKTVDAAVVASRAAEKLVQAKKDENDALVRTISLAGDEIATRRVAATAAADLAAQTDKLAAADRAIVTALEQSKARTLEYAAAQGYSADKVKASVEAIDKAIAAKEADAEKSRQQAAASKAAADQAVLAADAVLDTAGSYEALRERVDEAEAALEKVIRAFVLERATTEDVRKATEELSKAKGLLKNAMDDQASASKRVIDALKAESEFTKAQIDLQITQLKVKQQELVAQGNTTEATRLGNEIRALELQGTRAGTDAKRAEATETLRSTGLMITQGLQQGTLTAAREQELGTIIKQQQAVLLQTEASRVEQDATQKQNDTLANNTTTRVTNTATTGNATTVTNTNTGATRDNTQAVADAKPVLDGTAESVRRLADYYLKATDASVAWSTATIIEYGKVAQAMQKLYDAQVALDTALGQGPQGGNGVSGINDVSGNQASLNTSGSVLGATGSSSFTGSAQAANKPPDGLPWEYTLGTDFEIPGRTASGQWMQGGWRLSASYSAPPPGAVAGFGTSTAAGPFSSNYSPTLATAAPATYTTNVTIGGVTRSITSTSQAGVDAIIASLEDAYRAGGGT